LPTSTKIPLSIVAVDLGCVLFAAFTVVCNAVVLLGGNSFHLATAALSLTVGLSVAALVAARRERLGAWLALLGDPLDATREPDVERQPWPLVRIGLLGAAALIAFRFDAQRDLRELSLLAIGFFALSYAAVVRSDRGAQTPPGRGFCEWLLWALGLTCAGLTLCSHRPDSDDAFYVNLAVSVVDFPHRTLLSRDTLSGLDVPLGVAAYRAPSIELLSGLISYLTHWPTLQVSHLVVPPIVGLLTPLALARLLRVLDPRRWIFALVATLLYLCFDGGSHGSFGNFSFVRLFQGKAMFVTMVAPLVMAHGVRFGLAPSRRTFGMLAASQIAALGTTVTAFWAAPVLAGLAVLGAAAPRLKAWRTLCLGALASSYLLGLGLYFKWVEGGASALRAMAAPATDAAGSEAAAEATRQASDLIGKGYAMVLGHDTHLVAAVAVALCAWPLCRTPLARRFAVVFPLGFFAVLGNPWLTHAVAAVTTKTIYWRVVWLLPVPVLFGLGASSLLQPARRVQQIVRVPLFALFLYAFFTYVSPHTIFGTLRWPPHPKVDMRAYDVAQAIVRSMPPHRQVLAPLAVSRVLPMLNGYSHPLFVKASYLPTEDDDKHWRQQLTQAVSHGHLRSGGEAWLIDGLNHYRVEGVVMPPERGRRQPIARALHAAGFRAVEQAQGQLIWTRKL
jgi:hypothetical protein